MEGIIHGSKSVNSTQIIMQRLHQTSKAQNSSSIGILRYAPEFQSVSKDFQNGKPIFCVHILIILSQSEHNAD